MKKLFFFILFCYSLSITAQQSDALYIDSSGKVGIGTTAPQKTMHIKGELQVDSSINVKGGFTGKSFDGTKITGTTISGETLNLKSSSVGVNALRINQGNFSMGGPSTNPTFAIDADGVTAGRFLVDQKGSVAIGGNATIKGTTTSIGKLTAQDEMHVGNLLTISNSLTMGGELRIGASDKKAANAMAFLNKGHEWVFFTSSDPATVSGLTKNAFEIWDYYDRDSRRVNNRRFMILKATEANKPVVIDGAGNFYVDGTINGLHWSYSYNPPIPNIDAFDDEYDLMPLETLDEYIGANKELPGITLKPLSEEQDIFLEQLQMESLTKIKELTLYLIEMKKENDQLKKRIEALEAKMK